MAFHYDVLHPLYLVNANNFKKVVLPMRARITAYMVSRMVSEISSSLHFMRSTPEPDSELRPISSLKIRRLAFEIEQPGKEKKEMIKTNIIKFLQLILQIGIFVMCIL